MFTVKQEEIVRYLSLVSEIITRSEVAAVFVKSDDSLGFVDVERRLALAVNLNVNMST